MNLYEKIDTRDLIDACRRRDDDAFDELVRRYTPMMRKVVLGFEQSSYDYSELFSEACVALHIAAQKYDLEQNDVTFGLFARICVRNRIFDLVKRLDSVQTVSDMDVELLSDDNSLEKRLVDRETFDGLLDGAKVILSDYEYRVLLLHIQGYKTAAIAKALDRSAKSVDNAKSRLFRRLRTEFGNDPDN